MLIKYTNRYCDPIFMNCKMFDSMRNLYRENIKKKNMKVSLEMPADHQYLRSFDFINNNNNNNGCFLSKLFYKQTEFFFIKKLKKQNNNYY